jgi:hypothetical protein
MVLKSLFFEGTLQSTVETTDAKFAVMTSSKDVVRSACCAVVVDMMDIKPMVVNSVVNTLSKDTVDTTGGSIVGPSALADHDSSFTTTEQSSSTWI